MTWPRLDEAPPLRALVALGALQPSPDYEPPVAVETAAEAVVLLMAGGLVDVQRLSDADVGQVIKQATRRLGDMVLTFSMRLSSPERVLIGVGPPTNWALAAEADGMRP